MLDESGESALTFRALAARLGGGVGSVYWYVSSKEELLDKAADEVLGHVLVTTDGMVDGPDPIANLRAISVALFDEMLRRQWLGSYLLRNNGLPTNSLRLFDRLGRQLTRLDLAPKQQLEGASTVVSYVVGVAVDLAQPPPQDFLDSGLEPGEYLAMYADRWRSYDPEEFPFVTAIADVFAQHDDAEVFLAGLDLLLAGIRLQAEG